MASKKWRKSGEKWRKVEVKKVNKHSAWSWRKKKSCQKNANISKTKKDRKQRRKGGERGGNSLQDGVKNVEEKWRNVEVNWR